MLPVACASGLRLGSAGASPSLWFARRGSVLVLVMTLLGILFVVGVAFLATMNFEADMISAERLRSQSDNGVDAAVGDAGEILRNAIVASPGMPFGDSSKALSGSTFAELPGVQNSFSPIEPYKVSEGVGPDLILNTDDDEWRLSWGSYFDAEAYADGAFGGPSRRAYLSINTNLVNGDPIERVFVPLSGALYEDLVGRCKGNPGNGNPCDPTNPCTLPSVCEYPRVADADGDGIVDSLLVDAKLMGLSNEQLADLAARVNPPTNLAGKVSVAIRIVPHGGMVNLNDSHPLLIQGVFDLLPTNWPLPTDKSVDPSTGFRHGPTQDLIAYSPTFEESSLRRRFLIPPREFQPSLLHGNPLAADTAASGAHMPRQLFWWLRASGQQDVFATDSANANGHRFSPFSPTEPYPDEPNFFYWPVMMDPATADLAGAAPSPWNPAGTDLAYDRRHLVTTVSHDDLLARTAMVSTPKGEEDLRRAMIEANWFPPTKNAPDVGEPIVPFEYVFYPTTGLTGSDCDKENEDCVPSASKGRMRLSFSWIDEELAAASSGSFTLQEQQTYRDRIHRIIHDVFYMLVRNATQATEVEGMTCLSDRECPISDTVCRLRGAAPAAPPLPPFPGGEKGYCVHEANPNLVLFSNPDMPKGPGCGVGAICGIPGSVCGEGGICTLKAPAWRDVECPANACDANEICRPRCVAGVNAGQFCTVPADCPASVCGPAGLCADRWTLQPRSEALVSRVAASLTANVIDFADTDDVPTRIAIRDFDFSRPYTAGREIDTNTVAASKVACIDDGDCNMNAPVCSLLTDPFIASRVCIKPLYVYGLERQPYISEVTTLNRDADPFDVIARGIEIFNPYTADILAIDAAGNKQYALYEIDPAVGMGTANRIELGENLRGTLSARGPFTIFFSENPTGSSLELLDPPKGQPVLLSGSGQLKFENNWMIYLVRRVDYTAEISNPVVEEIVIDQFRVHGDGANRIGKDGVAEFGGLPPGTPFRFTLERVVQQASPWTAPIPLRKEGGQGHASLGDWNTTATDGTIHPVELQFADTGSFGVSTNPAVAASYPSTGSLLPLIRHSNRSILDYASPAGTVDALAFTSNLVGGPSVKVVFRDPPVTGAFQPPVTLDFKTELQIDNGRLPLFDTGQVGSNPNMGVQTLHHLSPALFKPWDPSGTIANSTDKALPGDLNTLPWGQLVFDYFTALPLSNGGPYDIHPSGSYLSLPEMPRVDQGGLRVHGRININAAPWKVLSGLPFIPMNQIADPAIRAKVDGVLTSPDPATAQPLGSDLAQAMVAYRDARSILNGPSPGTDGTGNYDDGSAAPNPITTPAQAFGRGWTNASPVVRRGTGFMSVGELANVRHAGATASAAPPGSSYRIDSGVIGSDVNKNNEDFIEAAAVLIALGDWVTVRSHVFTVYGQIRGADDPDVAALYTNPAQQAAALLQDTDARAIRFQETIDRLPVLQGQPRPQRIGERTIGRYTDVNND